MASLGAGVYKLSSFLFHALTQGQILEFGTREAHLIGQFGHIGEWVGTRGKHEDNRGFLIGLTIDFLIVQRRRLHEVRVVIGLHNETFHTVDDTVRSETSEHQQELESGHFIVLQW